MGKFTDTKYTATISSLIDASKSKLDNPYYVFADRKPTSVTYYAQNVENTTIDQSSGLIGAHLGQNAPTKFNKIKDFLIYGVDKIATDYDVGDFGVESGEINGEAIILPNTIIPKAGDFFCISYLKEPLVFIVNESTPDTLDTGANIYKIGYGLYSTYEKENLESQVIKEYNFIATNIGTEFKTILEDTSYQLIEHIEGLIEQLIVYFDNLFFDSRLQTFVYEKNGAMMYDPYMIEFLIRNQVLSYGAEYIYVSHATNTDKTFGMDYSRTFFNSLEHPTERPIKGNTIATADLITDPNSLFATRIESFYKIRYMDTAPIKTRFETIPVTVIDRIIENNPYKRGDNADIYNMWMAYFNNNSDFITEDIINTLKSMDYMDNDQYFYTLAISIYILEQFVKMLLQ